MMLKKFILLIIAILLIAATIPFKIFAANAKTGYYTYSVSGGKATITEVNTSISGNVNIPSTLGGYPVTSIGSYAFDKCIGLTFITIPKSVTSIGNGAFYRCAGLKSITIPDSVTSIGSTAFCGCSRLTSITIPDSVTTIGSNAFSGCTGLTTITIPNSVISIGSYAFSGCTGLASITIPNSIYLIEEGTFYDCTGLTSITIPHSVTSIQVYAFSGCTGLTSVIILESAARVYINPYAFSGCTELANIMIPKSASLGNESIPSGATIFCYSGSAAENYAIKNGNRYYLFENCGENTDFIFENDTLYIHGTGETANWKTQGGVPWYDYADQIKEVIIGEGITKIGTYAFYCLNNLESVICKNADTEFGRYALNEANGDITLYAQSGALTEYCGDNGIRFIDVTPTPELENYTANSVTIKTVSGYEYSKDTVNWQTGGIFTGLSPVTEYNIHARLAKTKDYFPGIISIPLTVTTDKANVSAPSKPVCIRNTDTEIKLQANDSYEYSIDGENWQKSNIFTGLIHGNTYSLYQRVAETETEYASPASAPLIMQLIKKTVSAPAAPGYKSHTDSSVTVISNPAYEYSIDGINWQTSATFENLSKNTIYRIYARVAETETEYASAPGKPLIIALPDAPQVTCGSDSFIAAKAVEGFEYCLDDFVWQDSPVFDKLIDNMDYTVYQRLKSVNGEKVYQITSEPTVVVTNGSLSGHNYIGVTTNPTCTERGYTTYTCTRCGDSYLDNYTDALNHPHTEIRNGKPATCLDNGYTGDTYCPDCGEIIKTGEIINATGHNFGEWTLTKAPTCTEKGVETRVCANDNSHIETRYVDAPGHDYKTAVTNPTCTERGYTTYTCSHCGDSYVDNYTEPAGHSAGEWITDKKPTFTETGTRYKICKVCGVETDREEIPVINGDSPRIEVESVTAGLGKTADVKIRLFNNPGITSAKVKVYFPDDLTLTAVNFGDIGGQVMTSQTLQSPVILNWFNGIADLEDSDILFATLTFKVNDDAAIGKKDITVEYNQKDVFNLEDESVNFAVIDGGINVIPYIPGDINGDSNVNNKDLTRLFQYLSEWDVEVNAAALDVNGDGNTNNKDLTRLFQYLSEWDVEIF